MRLKRMRVKNFRAIEDLRVDLTTQTAILGGNGCGKSTLLRAMERFFGPQSTMEADDFFGKDLTRTIEIELTFHEFNAYDAGLFSSRIHNAEMTVTRVFEAGGGRGNGRYYGSTLKHVAFDPIRSAEGARAMTAAYNQLRGGPPKYAVLPAIQRADQVEAALEIWEQNNLDECELGRDDGQFFGFTNVAKGALQKATNFVFVPAVRDVSADSVDAKGAVISKLMELVVRSAIQKRQDIRDFQSRISQEFRAITDPAQLPELDELAQGLSETLRMFYNEAGVALEWRPVEDFNIPLPAADVFLDDDGFRGPVDRKGNGLQRAFVVTLLQHLARASSDAAAQVEEAARAGDAGGAEADANVQEPPQVPAEITAITMPGLILAIEEPELYQHPTKQRHFARVLSELSSGLIPGVATSTQVIFASHSSLFVSVDRFEQIRIARRTSSTVNGLKTCAVRSASLNEIVGRLQQVHLLPAGTFTAESLRAKLHILGPELAEGFFANLVVLVEGVSDRAAIYASAQATGVDFEALGVAILPVGGKHNLDRPALIFAEFGIPTYVIWDCDSSITNEADRAHAATMNRVLQRMSGVAEVGLVDFTSFVGDRFACFDDKLETAMCNEIGSDAFQRHVEAVKLVYGVTKNRDALKTPVIVAEVLRRATAEGLQAQTLNQIVAAVVRLKSNAEMVEA